MAYVLKLKDVNVLLREIEAVSNVKEHEIKIPDGSTKRLYYYYTIYLKSSSELVVKSKDVSIDECRRLENEVKNIISKLEELR